MYNFADIDLKNVKAVLLDLDDTLYAYEPCQQNAFAASQALAKQNYQITSSDFEQSWKKARSKVHEDLHGQASSHSRLLYFQKQYELLFNLTNPAYALDLETCFWTAYLEAMQIDRDAKTFLEDLKSKNIKSCIVTDLTAQIQLKKILKLGLENYIDFLVSSEEAGVEKPGAAIFKLALAKLGVTASEVIMIGDNEKKDVIGAETLRIRSYLIKAKHAH